MTLQRIALGLSAATFTATEASNWTLVAQTTVSSWVASIVYMAGQIVTYAGRTIQKIATGSSTATFDATESALWTVTDRQMTNWVTGTYYELQDFVIFNTRNKDVMV